MKTILTLILLITVLVSNAQLKPHIIVRDTGHVVQLVGKDYVSLNANGILLKDTATQFDDIVMPFTTGTNAGNSYPTFNADSMRYTFITDTTGISKCQIYMICQNPHSIKPNSIIYPHVHYLHTTTGGTPIFAVKYKVYSINGTTFKGYKWYKMPLTTTTTNGRHAIAYNSMGIAGDGISAMTICAVYLYSQSGTGGIEAWQFDIHVEKNSIGSNREYKK